ncbi:MAG: nicotinate-nucleotide adenylyltransferase [Xanthobacteraceae bacterium]|nr:MAG: nicotinate-nucleotide adenylyltransferase [Xanthobacteraceae bacterium]
MREWIALPPHGPGSRIGLLGGSFNPPHATHREASLFAMKRLGLDRVWWLVTPGNPLKEPGDLAPLAARLHAARRLARHPRIDVSCLEAVIGTRYSDDTVAFLRRRCPAVRFVWLMGADNLFTFHRWHNWTRLARRVPMAVIDRPPHGFRALASPAALALARYRLAEDKAARLADRTPPAWVFLHGLKSPLSSTMLRRDPKKHALFSAP